MDVAKKRSDWKVREEARPASRFRFWHTGCNPCSENQDPPSTAGLVSLVSQQVRSDVDLVGGNLLDAKPLQDLRPVLCCEHVVWGQAAKAFTGEAVDVAHHQPRLFLGHLQLRPPSARYSGSAHGFFHRPPSRSSSRDVCRRGVSCTRQHGNASFYDQKYWRMGMKSTKMCDYKFRPLWFIQGANRTILGQIGSTILLISCRKSIYYVKILFPLNSSNVSYAIYGAIESQITDIYLIHLTSLRRFKTFWGQIRVSAYHA